MPGTGRSHADVALLDVKAASAILGMTEKALRRQLERGRVPHRKLGRKIVFIRVELERWVGQLPGLSVGDIQMMEERRGR